MKKITSLMASFWACLSLHAQINTGSNGSDGALDYGSLMNLGYSTNIVINMADHPTGIYQYTYINIPNNVTVTFIPNANNTPVYWLAQNGVVIDGSVNVSGQNNNGSQGGLGGPGGWAGGIGHNGASNPTDGQGPGGGFANGYTSANYGVTNSGIWPSSYGNVFLIPLLGGSGGAGGFGNSSGPGGGGGGGAILVAAANSVNIGGSIISWGGSGGGAGSGGAIRIIASQITGGGNVTTAVGLEGRVRFDTYDNEFSGNVSGQFTSGFQPIVIPSAGQIPQLMVTSVGGVPVSPSPTGVLSTPDAIISAQQSNPIPIVVNCTNLPLGASVTVTIVPITGSPVSAVGSNNAGTAASSTATVSITIPRGGGLIYATATMGN